MKTTSTLKAIILGTAVTTLFAAEAFAQANHNTTRSNKQSGGITAPQDTDTPIVAETDAAKKELDLKGHVTLVKSAKPDLTNCVTETGAVDANCDGVPDADQGDMNKDRRYTREERLKNTQTIPQRR